MDNLIVNRVRFQHVKAAFLKTAFGRKQSFPDVRFWPISAFRDRLKPNRNSQL
jgi:hypothetical protein